MAASENQRRILARFAEIGEKYAELTARQPAPTVGALADGLSAAQAAWFIWGDLAGPGGRMDEAELAAATRSIRIRQRHYERTLGRGH